MGTVTHLVDYIAAKEARRNTQANACRQPNLRLTARGKFVLGAMALTSLVIGVRTIEATTSHDYGCQQVVLGNRTAGTAIYEGLHDLGLNQSDIGNVAHSAASLALDEYMAKYDGAFPAPPTPLEVCAQDSFFGTDIKAHFLANN